MPLRNKCLLILLDFLNLLNAKKFWFMVMRKVDDPNGKGDHSRIMLYLKEEESSKKWNGIISISLSKLVNTITAQKNTCIKQTNCHPESKFCIECGLKQLKFKFRIGMGQIK